jgi:hypothetical protein
MNYNSIVNKTHETFDFKNNIFSSVHNFDDMKNPLINKNIDDYFNEIINKIEPVKTVNIIKTESFFSRFYNDYILDNMLLIVILIFICIYLVIRYYTKEFDNQNINTKIETKNILIKNKLDKKKLLNTQNKLLNYKKQLDFEKNKIISIIDELSTINYDDINKINQFQEKYQEDSKPSTEKKSIQHFNNTNTNNTKNYNEYNKYDDYGNDYLDNYYNIIKNDENYQQNNLINGMIVETPYN